MTRVPDWDVRLAEAVEAAKGVPFAWGRHDCATWAFDVREALTGIPRPAWSHRTEAGSRRWMLRQGWRSFAEAATAILGEPVPPMLAQRGDIVLLAEPEVFGVCLGAQIAAVGPVGLTFAPMRMAAMAWRV